MIYLLLVEDVYLDRKVARDILESNLQGIQIEEIKTESDFRNWVENPASHADAVVLDMMLPWTSASAERDSPREMDSPGDAQSAGLRCYRFLKDSAAHRKVPVVFLSSVEKPALPAGIPWVPKWESAGLPAVIRRLLTSAATAGDKG